MANFNRLILIFLILFSTGSHSTTVDLSNQSNFAKSSSGLMWATQASGAPTGALITGNRASVPFQYNVPSGQSLVPVSGVRESNLSLNRIGKAVTNFAKKVGPVAVGLAVADLVCDLADICNVDGVFKKDVDPNTVDVIGQHTGWCVSNGGSIPCYPNADFNQAIENANGCLTASNSNCFVDDIRPFNQGGNLIGVEYRFGFHSDGSHSPYYPATFIGTYNPPLTTTRDLVDSDWDNAEAVLNDERFVQPLFDAGEPLPVDQPDPFPPVNTITGSTTKTIRDGDGNIIGTEVTENTLTLSDVSSPDSPNLVDVTETKKVTTYDINNNITNTETSVSNPPPIEPPTEEQDQDIEFDDMAENELEEYEIPEINDFSSWGTGTCPPPIDIVTTHWNGQIDTQPICTYAEGLKPFVLLIAALSSAFIVSGSRQNVEV